MVEVAVEEHTMQRRKVLIGSAAPAALLPGQLMTQLLDQDRLRLDLGQKPRSSLGSSGKIIG